MTDLFTWTPPPKTGAELRDDGMALAEIGQMLVSPSWGDRAYAAIYQLAKKQEEVHVDDVLAVFTDRPSHPNAWGQVYTKLIKRGVIARSGRSAPCRSDPNKRAHVYPIYSSLIYDAGAE